MKWSALNLKVKGRMQWMLSMLAVVACLFSIASIHHHESGFHALDDACISCDLEDVSSHGVVLSIVSRETGGLSCIMPDQFRSSLLIASVSNPDSIRAPPALF